MLYRSKDGAQQKTFDALDWLALLTTHIPDRYEQTVKYYGHYSNRSRGDHKKAGRDEVIPMLMDAEVTGKKFKRNWARLIKKIYNVDPLICPKCQNRIFVRFLPHNIGETLLFDTQGWDCYRFSPRKEVLIPSL